MKWNRTQILLGGFVLVLAVGLAWVVVQRLITTRGAVQGYARLIASANAGDLATIRSLCTDRYLLEHPIQPARQGGVTGFPRQIHPNYQVWVQGDQVWLCQGNRVGLVVRFVRERGRWLYDGEVGLLRPDGQVVKPSRDDPRGNPEKP